jgi:Matrixin
MQRFRIVRLVPLLILLSTGLPRSAWAFCQTHTCEFSGTQMCTWDAAAGCWTGGAVAHWGSSCISYAVQASGSREEGISPSELASVLDDGFRSWSDVDCGSNGLSPGLTASYRGPTGCDRVEYNCGEKQDNDNPGNDNIVMFRDGRSDLSATTIALSTIIANTSTGEILDVDVEINSQDFDFYVNEQDARPEAHDLRLVLNHELGHFLGLSHTLAAGALMRAAYDGFDRFPAADDVAGICKTLKPQSSDPVCSAPSIDGAGVCVGADASCPAPLLQIEEGGCALSPGQASARQRTSHPAGNGSSGLWLLLGTGLLLLVRVGSTRSRPQALRCVI